MPDKDFYAGLSLDEKIAKLADHHHDPDTRHISSYESRILAMAAERLSEQAGSDEGEGEIGESSGSEPDPGPMIVGALIVGLAAFGAWKAAPHVSALWADRGAPRFERWKQRALGGAERYGSTDDSEADPT